MNWAEGETLVLPVPHTLAFALSPAWLARLEPASVHDCFTKPVRR